jgi:CheY-like chemotaxis protein
VLLPLVPSEAVPEQVAVAANATLVSGMPTILVVDDEFGLRRAMERFLERHGYEVLGAASGQEALQLLDARDWRVDLVVTDMVMPRMNGREFVRLLRDRRRDLPILCMSGHMEWEPDEDDSPTVPWSPDRLLSKPFLFTDFLERVRLTIAGEASEPRPTP